MEYKIVPPIIESQKIAQEVLDELLELLERNKFTITEALTLFNVAIRQLTDDMEISCDKIRKYN